jgi:hypothetical protein
MRRGGSPRTSPSCPSFRGSGNQIVELKVQPTRTILLLKDAPRHVGESAPLSGDSSFDLLTQVLRELFVFHCALMQSRVAPPERRTKKSPGVRAEAELGSSVTSSPTQSGSNRFEEWSQRVVAEVATPNKRH